MKKDLKDIILSREDKKLFSYINNIKKKLERGIEYDNIVHNQDQLKIIVSLLQDNNFNKFQIIKTLKVIKIEVEEFIRKKPYITKDRYTELELKKIRKSVESIKIILEPKIKEEISLPIFKAEKALGEYNQKWFDYLNEIDQAAIKDSKKKFIKNKINQIEYFACSLGTHLEKIDKRLKPSGYYKEDKDLPLGSELIFLICKFYDKTINRRRIMKDVFKNYKRIKEQVRRIDRVIQH